MRRITLWLMSTVSALVMLFSYHTSTQGGPAQASGGDGDAAPAPTQPAPVTPAPVSPTAIPAPGPTERPTGSPTVGPTGPSPAPAPTTSGQTTTIMGPAVPMKYGPVQVQVTIAKGAVVAVHAVTYPMSNHKDQMINSAAIPRLDNAATAAQSAQIEMVSGATYTSNAYKTSLQAALDKAHL